MKKTFITLYLLLLPTFVFSASCEVNELLLVNSSLEKLWVKEIKIEGNGSLSHLKEGDLVRKLDHIHARATAASGFSLHRHIASGDIVLRSDYQGKKTITLHYRFYPANNRCMAEGAVHFSGDIGGHVVVRPQISRHHHRARVEFVLLP